MRCCSPLFRSSSSSSSSSASPVLAGLRGEGSQHEPSDSQTRLPSRDKRPSSFVERYSMILYDNCIHDAVSTLAREPRAHHPRGIFWDILPRGPSRTFRIVMTVAMGGLRNFPGPMPFKIHSGLSRLLSLLQALRSENMLASGSLPPERLGNTTSQRPRTPSRR